MMLRMTDCYRGRSLRTHQDLVLGGAMRESGGTVAELAAQFGCKPKTVALLMRNDHVPDGDGAFVLSMTLQDFVGKSIFQARLAIENELVRSLVLRFGGERCNTMVASMLGINDRRVRRARERAGVPSTREVRAARLEREKTQRVAA